MSAAHTYAIPVAQASVDERAGFITRTYLHLIGAIGVFVGLETVLFETTELPYQSLVFLSQSRYSWLVVLGLFMGVGWFAERMARNATSLPIQYLGLGLYVVAEVFLFVPLLAMAVYFSGDRTLLPTAAIATLGIFGTLTAIVLITRRDFSFMRGALAIAGIAAMGLIVVSIVFGFALGPIFSVLMIALAAGYVLYYTSNVLHHYRTTQHVAASLALFAAIALLFWYVLQLMMQLRR